MNGGREWLKNYGAHANVYVSVAGIAIFSCVLSEAKWNRQTVRNSLLFLLAQSSPLRVPNQHRQNLYDS